MAEKGKSFHPKILLGLFFLSGSAALVYQVIWVRMFGMVFGVTAFAMATVLSSFMAGLALGGFYFGRIADRYGRPLLLFSVLEAGIGIFALLFPSLMSFLIAVYAWIYGHLHVNFYLFGLIRFLIAFGVLLIPTVLMGGTFPVLGKFLIRRMKELNWNVSLLYGVNNMGAFIGCCLAGFFLVKAVGLKTGIYIASFVNLAIAVITLLLERKVSPLKEEKTALEEEPPAGKGISYPSYMARLVMWVFAIEGIASLCYEVLWARVLIFFVGSSVYAFTAISATFILGLALGGFFVARFIGSKNDTVKIFGMVEILIGVFAILAVPVCGKLFYVMEKVSRIFGAKSMATVVLAEFVSASFVMLIPATLMGAVFPLVAGIYARSMKDIGKKIGNVCAVDTIGSILGPFVAGFILIPIFGLQRSIHWVAVLNITLGLLMLFLNPRVKGSLRAFSVAAVAGVLIAGNVFIPFNRPLITYSEIFERPIPQKLIYYREGIEDTVSVIETQEGLEMRRGKELYSNVNQAITDSRWDLPSNSIIGELPMLLHPHPETALVIGYGMGMTSWSILQHDVKIDAVEISPDIARVNRLGYFSNANHDVLDDERINLTVNDGRNYVLSTDKKYDMVSIGIIHPILDTGSSSFYTTEFYELCKKIINKNGIVCQWLPLHHVPEYDFKMLVRTFVAAFPHATIWYKYTTDFIILIGTQERLKIDFAAMERKMGIEKIRQDLAESDMDDIFALLDSFMMDEDTVRKFAGSGPLHTDDRPYVEFSIPKVRIMKDTTYENLLAMSSFRQSVLPLLTGTGSPGRTKEIEAKLQKYFVATRHTIQAQLLHCSDRRREAVYEYKRALALNPEDRNTKYLMNCAAEAQKMNDFSGGEEFLKNEKYAEAIEEYKKALEMDPHFLFALNSLAIAHYRNGETEKALDAFSHLIKIHPAYVQAYYSLAAIYADQGRFTEAKAELEKALTINPAFEEARTGLEKLEAMISTKKLQEKGY